MTRKMASREQHNSGGGNGGGGHGFDFPSSGFGSGGRGHPQGQRGFMKPQQVRGVYYDEEYERSSTYQSPSTFCIHKGPKFVFSMIMCE